MKKIILDVFDTPWYPIAISAYPVLALYTVNKGEIQPGAVVRPLLISILFGGFLFLLCWLFIRKVHKAAFLSTLLLALFFSYGHAYIYIDAKYRESNYTLWLAIGWIVLIILAFFWVTRPKLTFISSASTLNVVALALLVMSVGQLGFGNNLRSAHALGSEKAPIATDLVRPANPPDVYLFVLDMYARSDLLEQAYGFDNSKFIDELEQRGFFVAQCSQSNYVRTELSLGSSLNMQYLPELNDTFTPDSISRDVLWDTLRHNAVRYNFENMGYQTVTYKTGFAWMDISDSDHFMSPPAVYSGMTEFEGLFLRTTLARYVENLGLVDPDYIMALEYRDRFKYIFTSIDDVAKMKQPTFSYIHVISPHPPFVFDAEGNPTNPADFWNEQRIYPESLFQKGYLSQLQYLNKNMLQAVDAILANSETPPIIIIQGDHGPWLQSGSKHFRILNAIYFPGHEDKLYPTISPVNTFRLVFNNYFSGKYDILDDISYFSPVPNLYRFSEVSYPCESPEN